jgi:hypothetical protein
MNDTPETVGNSPFSQEEQEAVAAYPPLITWREREFQVMVTKYVENDNTCLAIINPEDGAIEAKATVNIGTLAPHLCYIKDYSENRGLATALTHAGLVQDEGKPVRNGSVEFGLYSLTPKFGLMAGIEVPESVSPFETDLTLDQAAEADPKPQGHVPSDEDVGESPVGFDDCLLSEDDEGEVNAIEPDPTAEGGNSPEPEDDMPPAA